MSKHDDPGNKDKSGGYQPLNKGYSPREKRGYVPGDQNGRLPKPPVGGTGQTRPPTSSTHSDTSSKK